LLRCLSCLWNEWARLSNGTPPLHIKAPAAAGLRPQREKLPFVAPGAAIVRYRTARASGTLRLACAFPVANTRRFSMNAIIYLVGLVVVVMFILSLVGLR
jgi:hypothetical protein